MREISDASAKPELRPVRGPSALGGGTQRFFELLYLIAVTEFRRTYFGTVLGYAWSLLRPFILFGILLVVFTRIFRIGSTVENYEVMLLLNIVLFGFFQEATAGATPSVVRQEAIVRKTQFPRLVIPLAPVLTSLFNLGTNLIAVVIFMLFFGVGPAWTWLLFPVLLVLLVAFTCGFSLLLSALFVRHRDTLIIWTVLSTGLFYGSAVLYPIEIVTGTLQDILLQNPLTLIFVQMRQWVVDADAPGAVEAIGGWPQMLVPVAIFVGVCTLGAWLFGREAVRAAEEL